MTTVTLSKLGLSALAYAEQLVLYVLPLWGVENGVCRCPKGAACGRDTGKHPIKNLVPHGKNDASNDPETIREWWRQEPDANIGLQCGMSGLVTVDIDPRNGGNVTWEHLLDEYGVPPDTFQAESGGGGQHIVFRRPSELSARDTRLGAGIDIKADGYIIVAPSVHRSGREYMWLAEADPFAGAPLAAPPDWLVESINSREKVTTSLTEVSDLTFRPGATPPEEIFAALALDPVLKEIWYRKRRSQAQTDDSPSGWVMSLRKKLLQYQLTPQEALDTIVAYRRFHLDPPKKPQWYHKEASEYAADLLAPINPSSIGDPPPSLRRNPRPKDLARDAVEVAMRHSEKLPPRATAERLLLIHMSGFARDGESAWPSQQRLGQATGLTIGHVSKRIGNLERWGCIEKTRHSGPGTTNKYRLGIWDTTHEHKD